MYIVCNISMWYVQLNKLYSYHNEYNQQSDTGKLPSITSKVTNTNVDTVYNSIQIA